MRVIMFSGKAGCGKDTAAAIMKDVLEERGKKVLITHFADLVKYTCKTFFDWDGKKDEAGRTLLQFVGTDKVRAVDPNFWVDYVLKMVVIFKCWDYVLIPDCRFPNEHEVFLAAANESHEFDVKLVGIERPGFQSALTEEQQNHPSETAMDDYTHDYIIVNCSDVSGLRECVEDMVSVIEGSTDEEYAKRAANAFGSVTEILKTVFCEKYNDFVETHEYYSDALTHAILDTISFAEKMCSPIIRPYHNIAKTLCDESEPADTLEDEVVNSIIRCILDDVSEM